TPPCRDLRTPVRPRPRAAALDSPVLVSASTRPRCRPDSRGLPRLPVRTGFRPPAQYRRPPGLLPARAVRTAAVVGLPPARGSGPYGRRFPWRLPRPPGPTGASRCDLCPRGAATLGHGDGSAGDHGRRRRNLPPRLLPRGPRRRCRLPVGG